MWRVVAVLGLDLLISGGGAAWLWRTGSQTAVDGPLAAQVMLVAATACALALRAGLVGRADDEAANRRAVSIDRAVLTVELVLAGGFTVVWLVLHRYYLGWVLTYAAVLGLLASSLQLLADVTTGRNRSAAGKDASIGPQRLRSLEAWRLLEIAVAVAVLVATVSVHRWNPAILNPIGALVTGSLAMAVPTRYGLVALHRRRTQF